VHREYYADRGTFHNLSYACMAAAYAMSLTACASRLEIAINHVCKHSEQLFASKLDIGLFLLTQSNAVRIITTYMQSGP